jgi:hypothetical protein
MKIEEYTGSRSLEDLLQFVSKHLPDSASAEEKPTKEEL